MPTVSFATSCWERDWKSILLDPEYLKTKQIGNHGFPFAEKLLVINNVKDLPAVKKAAQAKIDEGVLTRYVVADEIAEELLRSFHLKRSSFLPGNDAHKFTGVNPDWIYYNSLAPLAAVYACKSDFLLYMTGDVRLDEPVQWIEKALRRMEKKSTYKVANLTWFHNYKEARKESYKSERDFYVAKQGFSDTLFLVRRTDFQKPIYNEIRADAGHYPRGDVFEKRVFSYMKNRGWERITFRHGTYIHEHL